MSIISRAGDLVRHTENGILTALGTASNRFKDIVGSANVGLTNIWSGGFAGMSETGLIELKNQLTSYCNDIQDLIGSFDQTGDISTALKGEVQTAAYEFIGAVKELLQAYVSRMRQEIAEVDEAYQNFMTGAKSISQDVKADASDIRSNASSIRLD